MSWWIVAPLLAVVAFTSGIMAMGLAVGWVGDGVQLVPFALGGAALGALAARWHMRGLGYWPVR